MRIEMHAWWADGEEIPAYRDGKRVPLGDGLTTMEAASARADRVLAAGAAHVKWHDADDMIEIDDMLPPIPRELHMAERIPAPDPRRRPNGARATIRAPRKATPKP